MKNPNILKQDVLENGKFVSTVRLSFDHNFFGPKEEPHLFETMVFPEKGKWLDLACERYSTKEQALKGHDELVKKYS